MSEKDPHDPQHLETRQAWAETHLLDWRRDANPSTWGSARCQLPSHGGEDKKPSFRFNLATGGAKCLGCQFEGLILEYAEQCSLPTEGLPRFGKDAPQEEKPKKKRGSLGKEIDWYTYHTADGKPTYRVVRYEPKDFRLQYWDDEKQVWKMGRNGLPLLPMGLHRLKEEISPDVPVLWVEGEKDVRNAMSYLGLLATTTPHGASNFHHVDRSSLEVFRGQWVVLVPDNDTQGRDYMAEVGKALKPLCSLLMVMELPGLAPKEDLSDWIRRSPDPKGEFWKLLEGIECCSEYVSDGSVLGDRPEVVLGDRELHDVSGEALQALKAWNEPPVLFSRAGGMVRVVMDEQGHLVEPMGVDGILGYLSESARWYREGKKTRYLVFPDRTVATDLVVRKWDELPPLTEFSHAPVFDTDLRLIRKTGYDKASGVYVDCRVRLPLRIPSDVSDVRAARDLLLDKMLADFPFVDEPSRANAVATILLPFVRRLVGPTPLHLFESPSAGTGKGLLASIVSIPSTGRAPAITTGSKDPAEFKKAITSKLMAMPVYVMIDEIQSCLYSDILASVLTSDVWEDRVLGKSKVVAIPNRACWLGAGNNLQVKRDIARRSVWIRLDRGVPNPWSYQQFQTPDIQGWCLEHRQQLTLACLTLCQAWVNKGCPDGPLAIGSFERYSRVLGGILAHAGIPGFLENHEINVQRSDVASEEWEEFILAWWHEFGGRRVEVTELAKLMEDRGLMGGLITNPTLAGRRVSLGKRLGGQVDRIWPCGLTIRIAVLKNEKGVRLYRLEKSNDQLPTSKEEVADAVHEVFAVSGAGKAIL